MFNRIARAARPALLFLLIAFAATSAQAAAKTGTAPLAVPNMTINDVSIVEGNTGIKTAYFTVSLSSPATSEVTYYYSTAEGNAVGNDDFDHAYSSPRTISPGESSATIAIDIRGDSVIEADETFEVILAGVTNATLVDGVGVGTIVNDDSGASATLVVGDVRISEGNSGTKTANFVVQLSKAAASAVSFSIATANGTASAGSDYTAISLSNQSIPAGQIYKSFSITINGDTSTESDETFTVNLSNPSGAAISRGQATGTIANDDNVSAVKISVWDLYVTEGNSGTKTVDFTVKLSQAAASPVTFDIKTEDSTAIAGSDYVAKALTNQSIAVGQTSRTFSVVVNGDTLDEGEERFLVALSNITNAAVEWSDTHGVAVIPNDDATLSIGDVSQAEGDSGSTTFLFPVSLSAPLADSIMFHVATCDGTAKASEGDYWSVSDVTWWQLPAGSTRVNIPVTVQGDIEMEGDETFCIDLIDVPAGVALGDTHAIGTILNDDLGPATISIGNASISEGDNDFKIMLFPVTFSHAPKQGVTLRYHTTSNGGTATAGVDYSPAVDASVMLPGTMTSFFIEIGVRGDTDHEPDETFSVVLDSADGALLGNTTATGTIVNDDTSAGPAELSVSDVSVTEGNAGTKLASFVISLSHPSNSDVTFNYATDYTTATPDEDFVPLQAYSQSIPAGQISKTVAVTIRGDVVPEADELFSLFVSNVSGAVVIDGSGTGTIVDDDTANAPFISIGDVTVTEGDSGTANARFTVSLSGPSAYEVVFDVRTADITATSSANADYSALWLTYQTIPAGQTSKTFDVAITGDNLNEANETFAVNLSNIIGARIGDNQAIGTIVDDDPVPTITFSGFSMAEGNDFPSYPAFTATLSEPAMHDVTFYAYTMDGTAKENEDYAGFSSFVTIAAGQTSTTVQIRVTGDTQPELDETFTLNIQMVTGATPANLQATGTILNDDGAIPPPTLTFQTTWGNEGSNGPELRGVTAWLTYATDHPVTFDYATADNTAIADQDYVSAAGSITIPQGQNSASFMLTVNGDTEIESDESFKVNISNVAGATYAGSPVNIVMYNDDFVVPDISINDVTIAEGGDGQTSTATFTISLSQVRPVPLYVDVATASGTATGGVDFYSKSVTSLMIAGGSLSGTFQVQIAGDAVPEPDETFSVNLSNAFGANIVDAQGIGTITNDDGAVLPTLSIGDVSIAEGNSGTKTATFTVSLSAASATAVTYDIATSNGTATAGSDYVASSLSGQSIAAGQTSRTFTVTINGDTVVEQDETFNVTVSNVAGATIADGSAVGAITNDDASTSPTLSIGDVSIVEGNSGSKLATFTLTLSAPAATAVTYNIATAAGTATAPSDFVTKSMTGQSIVAGQTSKTFTVSIKGDTLSEPDETFFVDVTNVAGATLADGQAVGTITNDDAVVVPTISVSDGSLVEGNSGSNLMHFLVTLSEPAGSLITFDGATVDGSASGASDFVPANWGLVFQPGWTSFEIVVPINGDTTVEADETFTIVLSNAVGATFADAQATGTIVNDDSNGAPTLSIGDVSISEGNSGSKTATFTVSLSAAAAGAVTYDIATSNGTATAGSDYVASSLSGQSIAVGQTSKTFSVTINGDTAVESDETFAVAVSNVVGASIADGSAIGTITNDDTASGPTLSIDDVSIVEGNSNSKLATFTLILSAPASGAVTYNIATAAGTATAPADFVNKSMTGQSIAAGQTSKTFTVSIKGDTVTEPDETFFVNVSNVAGATLADGQAVGTITNDDGVATPTLSIGDVSLAEGNSGTKTATFTVSLSAAAAGTVTYDIATGNGTATAGSDYVASSLSGQSIAAGQTSKTFSVTINGDTTVESDETFTVTVSNVAGATIADGSAIGTITNDDSSGSPTLSIGDVSIAEGNSGTKTATFTVSLSAAAANAVTYDIATSNGTATAGSDYVANSLSGQSIAAGQTSQTFSVTINGDTTVESDETFTVTVSNVAGATISDGSAIGTIANDDTSGGGPTLSIGDVTLAEGNALSTQFTFTISLSAAASSAVTFNIATADGTALAGSDYTAKSLSAQSIAAGQTSKTFLVAVKGDRTVEPNETFLVNVTNVAGATLADGQAVGTITNDDAGLVSIARVATGGLVDDIDDGNGQPVLGKDDYALLLLDTAQAVCERAQAPTIVGIDGVENKAVLEELAEAANALCARKTKYAAVFNDEQGSDGLGFLVDIADETHLEGVSVVDARDLGQHAKVSTLTVLANGHDQAITLLLTREAEAASSKPRQANELDHYLVARRKLDPDARLVVLGASGLSGLVDVSARAAQAQRPTTLPVELPAERIFVSQPLLDAFGASSLVLPGKTVDPQVLNLR